MFKRILIPLDTTAEGLAILPEMKRLAAPDAKIWLLHVAPRINLPANVTPDQMLDAVEGNDRFLEKVAEELSTFECLPVIREGDPADQIARLALEVNIDLIAMTTHARRGLSRMLLGSVAIEVVRRAALPILLARPGIPAPTRPIRRILFPVGEGLKIGAVMDSIASLAKQSDAEVILLHVMPMVAMVGSTGMYPMPPEVIRGAESRLLPELERRLHAEGLKARSMELTGSPTDEILNTARKLDVDLIVMPTEGRHGLERLFLGSVAEGVVKGMDRPVLLQKVARQP